MMAITVNHDLNPLLVGQVAFDAGYAQFAQQQAERDRLARLQAMQQSNADRQFGLDAAQLQHRFELDEAQLSNEDRRFALAERGQEQGFDLDNRRLAIQSQAEEARRLQDAYQFQQGLENSHRARRAQMAADFMRQQSAMGQNFLEQAFSAQNSQDELSRQALGQQHQWNLSNSRFAQEMELDYRKELYKRSQNDWATLLRARPGLDDAQWQQAVDQFNERYTTLGIPSPLAADLPEADDPDLDAIQQQVSQTNPGVVLSRDPKGKIYAVYGPQYTPEYLDRQYKERIEIENIKSGNKNAEANNKIIQDQQNAEDKRIQAEADHAQRLRHQDENNYYDSAMRAHQAAKPDIDEYRSTSVVDGQKVDAVDYAKYRTAVDSWRKAAPKLQGRRVMVDGRILLNSDADGIGLTDGTPVIDPNGRTGVWTN